MAFTSPAAVPKEHHAEVDSSLSAGFDSRNDVTFQFGALLLPIDDERGESQEDAADAAASLDDKSTFQQSRGPASKRSCNNKLSLI